MIERLDTMEARRMVRCQLIRDDVFIIAHEAVKELTPKYAVEELFLEARKLADYICANRIVEREFLEYDVDELRAEVDDELSLHLILCLTLLHLLALRKTREIAAEAARGLMHFCMAYEGMADFLCKVRTKEQKCWIQGKRCELVNYHLTEVLQSDSDVKVKRQLVMEITDLAGAYDEKVMGGVLAVLSEYNDHNGHTYQESVDMLRQKMKEKSDPSIHIDRVNDIYGNEKVILADGQRCNW